jgi:PEP-CTERM motif
MRAAILAAWAIALIGALPSVSAGPSANEMGPNIVGNGGFESGLAGWSTSGFQLQGFDFGIDSFAHTGSSSFQGGAIESLGLLSQSLATTAGTTYNIDLWLASDGFFENEFQVLWNGQVIYDRTDLFPQGFTQVVIDPMATGPVTALSFGFRDDSGFLHVDDISVRAVSAVPEPSAFALIAVGLATLGRANWKKRNRPTNDSPGAAGKA